MLKVDVALVLELVSEPLEGIQSVMIDALRASSTIVTALASGVPYIVPVETLEQATKAAKQIKAPVALGGERNKVKPPGFDFGNSPLEYAGAQQRTPIVFSTTNGTRALQRLETSARVLVGSLLNASAVARSLVADGRQVLLVCAGTKGSPAAEDIFAAGLIIEEMQKLTHLQLSDSAQVAWRSYLAVADSLPANMAATRSGVGLAALGFSTDVEFCARVNLHAVVPLYSEGTLKPI